MAELNHLETGVDPPDSDKYVVVARDVTGGFYVESSEPGYARGTPAGEYPIDETDRDAAIERAKALADRVGVKTVYVVS
jgi:hypothetical protein